MGPTPRIVTKLTLALRKVRSNTCVSFVKADDVLHGKQNSSNAQASQAPAPSSPRMARKGRGRPCRSRTVITLHNAAREELKILGDKPSGEGWVVKVQAEAWLVEEDLASLRDVIAIYRVKQGRMNGKRKCVKDRGALCRQRGNSFKP